MRAINLWSKLGDLAGLVATPLAPSHYLSLVAPLAASHVLQARVEAVVDETSDTRTLTLRPGRGWQRHRAGQHLRVSVPIAGRLVTRTYSISSAPERRDRCVTITVKAMGQASRALHAVSPGTYLPISLPAGDFVVPPTTLAALFVTGGSGITPVIAMLRSFAAQRAMPDIAHVHYARTADDVIFGRELVALAAAHPSYRVTIVLTETGARERPRLTPCALTSIVPDWASRETWACGPAGILEGIAACCALGHRADQLHVERFRATFAPPPTDDAGGLVRFTASGREVRADGRTPLLRVAEDAGLHPRHGCRMGICHSCDTTLIAGCVRDLRTGRQITEPGARIQPCVCAASGAVELDL